jgi:HEPN domain-containing protein
MSGRAPLDDEEFRRWRTEADRALRSARLQAREELHNWACFAAEQAAQLAVKGLLHGIGRGAWGHDLVHLGEMLGDGEIDVPADLADRLRRLGRHYIPARYPDAHPAGPAGSHYGEADAAEAIGDADEIHRFVDGTWEELHGGTG